MRASSAFLIAIMAAGLAGCGDSGPQAVTPVLAASEPSTPPVAKPAAAGARSDAFVTSGPLLVEDEVDLAAQRPGVVAQLLVDLGQSVRKGQLLATLDDRQLTAERDAA